MGWFKKDVVEDYLKLDMARIKLYGNYNNMSFSWGENKESSIGLIVDIDQMTARFGYSVINKTENTNKDINYTFPLDSTPCYFGGKRYWFRCQGIKDGVPCNRRVRVLYQGNPYFVCRHCLNLSYKSKQKSRYREPILKAMRALIESEEIMNSLVEPKRKYYKNKPTKPFERYCKQIEKANLKARLFSTIAAENAT